MARARLQEEIRRLVKENEYNEASLLQCLKERGEGAEAKRALQELLISGELIAQHTSKNIKRLLCLAADLKQNALPIVLRPRLDMSRRIYYALFTYRKLEAEVSRDELKALVKQVYTIERFTPEDYEAYFAYGLKRAIESGKIKQIENAPGRYQSGVRAKELLVCALCDNLKSNPHERKLECTNCRWARHASCMGLRKHKITGDFECEKCTRCADCGQEPTACNPLAWCTACYKPKHARGCGRQETQGEEFDAPCTRLCSDCGGTQLTSPAKETDSFSPLSLQPTCSSASSSAAMATPGSEKGVAGKLSDSLSAYFTPSCEGRRRHKQINIHEDSTSDEEPEDRVTRHMRPLTVEVSGEGGSGVPSKTPPSSSASSHHRRAEAQLHDALSPYFSAASGKRRSAVKGEYARMHGGASAADASMLMLSPGAASHSSGFLASPRRSRGGRQRISSLVGSPHSSAKEEPEEEGEEEEEEEAEEHKMSVASPRKSNGASPSKKRGGGADEEHWRLLGRSTQNSASAALFSSPDDERRRRGSKGGGVVKKEESESEGSPRRSKPGGRLPPSSAAAAATPKSPAHKRLKREMKSSDEDTSQLDSECTDSDDKPLMRRGAAASIRTPVAATPSTSAASEKKSSKKQQKDDHPKSGVRKELIRAHSPIDSTGTGAGSSIAGFEAWSDMKITQEQWAGYEACTKKANESIEKTPLLSADGSEIPRWPETICFGQWEMETWFTAPYPNEYANTKRLFICEFCLKYMRTLPQLIRHAKKCVAWHPPGNEIYRKDDVSVFEVDGNVAGLYCQNLCLLAKLYLDHKTLYYDVEPFLFYIVTKNDERGCHFVGYFSKEKYSAQKFNLSCIVTLPSYHKQGFGRFLIDFSYLLTRREKMVGTPERPLSDLGRVSYAAYWKSALLEYLRKKIRVEKRAEFKLNEIAVETGISLYDVVEVLEALGMLVKSENSGGIEFLYKDDLVEAHWKRAQTNKERIWIDESCLKWSPTAHTPSKDFMTVRSPPRVVSPTPSHHGVTPTGVPVAACGSTIKRGPLAAANAGPAGAAAAAAAAGGVSGGGSSPRKIPASRINDKKRAIRQLKLDDLGFMPSPKATSTPARKSRRIAGASEDSSLASTSSDEEKKPETKSTCKTDSTRRRNRRSEDSDSSDDEKDVGGATPKKRPSAPGPSSASNGRRASAASKKGSAPSSSTPKSKKRGTQRRESEDDEEGEVSSAYATTSSSSESESDVDASFRPQSGRRPTAPSKGKKGGKGSKPTPNIPKKGKQAPQKGKKNGITTAAAAAASSSPPVMVNKKKKELKSPGKVFPPNYLQTIAARKQQAAAAAAESAAAPGCSSQAAAISGDAAAAAGESAADEGRASPADSLCSTATIPMRQAPDAADQSMMTDDAHESEGRDHTPGPSASAMSSRPSSAVRGRRMERRRNGRGKRETSEEHSDSSVGGSSSGSSLFRAISPRPLGDRVPSTSGGTMNMGWDEEETDPDRTIRMEQMADGAAPPVSSSSSERPPSLQAMSPMEQRPPEEPDQPTLGSLLSDEMAKGAVGSAATPQSQLSQPRKSSAAVAAAPHSMMMNGVCKPGPSGISAAAAASCSTDDSEDDAPPCLSPQYHRGECEGDFAAGAGVGGGASSSNEDGGASSDASAAPILAPSNVTRSISLDHTPIAAASVASAASAAGPSSNHAVMGRRISEQSCAVAAAAVAAYDPFSTPPKAPLPHADQLLSERPSMDVGVSHQELNFGMAPHSLHGRLSGGEAGPGPPGAAQTSPLLQQSQLHQTTPLLQQPQHATPQMMTYPGSASGGGMQSTPGSVPSAHNTPEMLQQSQQTTTLLQQPQQLQMQQFASPTMQQQMYTQQPSSVHSTHSGHHDMSGGGGGGGGPGSVPAGYGQQMMQGGHSNPSTPLRGVGGGGPGSANQPPFNSPTPVPQPMSVPDHHAAATAAAPALAGRRSSEAASVGPPASAAAATKKRSSAGAGATPALPSPLAAQQQQQAQLQQQQQLQMMMMQQTMQYQQYMQYNPMAYNNGYMHSWPTAAAAPAFPAMGYPAGVMQVPSGKNGGVAAAAAAAAHMPAAAVAAAAAASSPFYMAYPGMQHMQQMQQQQQQQQQQRAAAAAAATSQWQQRPTIGPPFPGTAAAVPDANGFALNGTMPSYTFQQAQPSFPQQY